METIDTATPKPLKTFTFTVREAGVFLLLLFLNLKFISITVIQDRSLVIDIIVYLLFILTFNYNNWTYKALLPTLAVVGVYTLINFSEFKLNVLVPLIIMQAVSAIRFRRYLWINLIITGGTLALMFKTFGLGVNLAGYSFLIDRQIRMSFGFNHPNVAAMYYFCFMINLLLLLNFSKWKKVIPLYLLVIIPLWVFIYKQTGSRSFLLSLAVLYASYFYYFLGIIINKKYLLVITRYVFVALLLLFTLLTVYFTLAKDNFVILDQLLSGRLSLYNRFFSDLTFIDFIFGSDAYKDNVIDSSYVHLLFEAGILFFLLMAWFYILSAYRMVVEKAWVPVCVIISFLAYGLMETMLLYGMLIGSNIFWVLLYYYYKRGEMRL